MGPLSIPGGSHERTQKKMCYALAMVAWTSWLKPWACIVLLTACDFGTLDDLSQDEAAAGTTETATQALKLWKACPQSDDEVKKAVADIAGVIERAGTRPVQVTIDDLTKADLGLPAITRDPSVGQGMLVITELDCSLSQIEKPAVASNQAAIYPGSYDKYKRTYSSSAPDFVSGAAPNLGWKTEYTVSLLALTYAAILTGGARRVPGVAPGGGGAAPQPHRARSARTLHRR